MSSGAERFVPGHPPANDPDEESLDVWGFRDSRFRVNASDCVEFTGTRYPLAGQELPALLPWVQRTLQLELDPRDTNPSQYPPAIPPARSAAAFVEELGKTFAPDQLCDDPQQRLRHGHGHTQAEMYAIKYGSLARVPDLVVYPASHDQVVALVDAARRHRVCLIPYGGGTNVSEALRCPQDEARPIASVDLRRMNRILWIDPENQLACIEAGAVGRHLVTQLAEHGFTLGHEPDSIELSTLGGWVATHASGMKKNRYGNIEDLVLDVTVVGADGVLSRPAVFPRESAGVDVRRFVFGSEGTLGIVTRAVVKLFPLPEVQRYGSIVFPDFERGLAFMRELTRIGAAPASVRLVDNLQFQFSQALKPAKRGARAWLSAAERFYVTRVRGFDPERMVACTLVFEGERDEVRQQERRLYAIARRHGGLAAGSENGERGYQMTFAIAYIRDFVMNHYILGESFETSVPWSQVAELCERVVARVHREHAARGLPGRPFVTCRVTQVYPTGVCVYFYFAYYFKGVDDPSGVYADMEHAAREEILAAGGSISHHHGVGKLRQRFLPEVVSPAALAWSRELKRAVDPDDVFGSRNLTTR